MERHDAILLDMAKNISGYDCVVLATDHDSFDYVLLQQHAQVTVDTRGRLSVADNTVAA